METRRKAATRLHTGRTQSLITDALHLFSDLSQSTGPGEQPGSLTKCELKAALNRAIHLYDFTAVADLLSASPFMTRLGQHTAQNHRQDILDHCLFALYCKLKLSRRALHNGGADELCYVYRWAHNKDVAFTGENSVLILELLLAAGANPCSADQNGLTYLHWLAQRREDAGSLRRIVDLFVNAGCNLEARDGVYGATPLGWSAWFGLAPHPYAHSIPQPPSRRWKSQQLRRTQPPVSPTLRCSRRSRRFSHGVRRG